MQSCEENWRCGVCKEVLGSLGRNCEIETNRSPYIEKCKYKKGVSKV
jgi:hypothetical protein